MLNCFAACPICKGPSKRWRMVEEVPVLRCLTASCGFRFFDLGLWRPLDCDYYCKWHPEQPKYWAPWIQARVQIVRKFKKDGIAAELGCGIGETAIALGNAGFSVVGVDESMKAIQFLRDNYSRIEWRQESITKFVASHSWNFDVITMFHVLEHIPDPQPLIQSIARSLRPDGLVVIEVPDVGGGIARFRGAGWDYFQRTHVNYFDVRSLGRLMETFGFHRRFLQRTYHFSHPQGNLLKDLAKGCLATLGLNAIIRTAWTR